MKRFTINCGISLVLSFGLILILSWLLGETLPVVRADGNLFVTPAGCGNCTQAQPCMLQAALNQAANGNTIYLAAGNYVGSGGAVVTVTKSITLAGGWDGTTATPVVRDPDTHLTKLDGQGQRRAVYIGGSVNVTLDGLHLLGGLSSDSGGGVYAATGSNTAITGCRIYSNTAQVRGEGGGLYIRGNIIMTGNRIYSNTVQGTHGNGAGIALVTSNNAALIGNQIYGNQSLSTSGMGGGLISYRSNATLTDNDIHDNTTQGSGGGININETASNNVTLTGNRIYSNHAGFGGGVIVGDCPVTITGNLIYANSATQGGGLWFNISDATLINNIVADNRVASGPGGIVVAGSDVRMLHTTIARNSGSDSSGILVTNFGANTSKVAMTNTILVSHAIGIFVDSGHTAALEATLWGDGVWANGIDWSGTGSITTGTVNVRGDPAFFIPAAFDYHILPESAAVNAGVNAGVTVDIDGQARPRDTLYDIGADELDDYTFLHLPLVLRN
jgi:hypothetical protein